MTNRTASLLLLFVVAWLLTALMMAMVLSLLVRADMPSPWVMPASALLCFTGTLFVGRHAILPADIAGSRVRAWLTLSMIVGVGIAGVSLILWLVTAVGVRVRSGVTIALGFAGLWLAVRALHRGSWRLPLP